MLATIQYLLVCTFGAPTIFAQSPPTPEEPEILEYLTTIELLDATDFTTENLSGLKKSFEERISETFDASAPLKSVRKGTAANTLELIYVHSSTAWSLEIILANVDITNAILNEGLNRPNAALYSRYATAVTLAFQKKVVFSISGVTRALPVALQEDVRKDITVFTNENVGDVEVLEVSQSFIAYARMSAVNAQRFDALVQNSGTASWLLNTARSLGVSSSELRLESIRTESFPLARGYIDFSFRDNPQQASISDLLADGKKVGSLEFAIFEDMRRLLGLPDSDEADKMIPFSEIIQVTDLGFILAYDISDPMMWTMGRLAEQASSFQLTSAQAYLNQELSTSGVRYLKVASMEQQDVLTEGYATISMTFVGTRNIMKGENAIHGMEFALRADIIRTAGLLKEDLFDVKIDRNAIFANNSFQFYVEPNSQEALESLVKFLEEKVDDSSWLVQARARQPDIIFARYDVGISGNKNGPAPSVDQTCRIGGIYCDHIRGGVMLIVVLIVISALGYFFVIYRPSKKKIQLDAARELPPHSHTFVFTRSASASSHRSAGSSFHGSHHGRRP